jgi:hypothetical protein
MLAVEQQPVEVGGGADFGGVCVGQRKPQTDLRLLVCECKLEIVGVQGIP